MKFKKYILTAIVIITVIAGYFSFYALPSSGNTSYAGAISRLQAIGVMNPNEYGSTWPDGNITREEFAKALAIASGLEDDAKAAMGTTIFPDIEPGRVTSGYINVVVAKGLMTGMADGKFHPEGSVNFAQASTIAVKALGYTSSDLSGTWPKNSITKAKVLGLTGGVDFNTNDNLPKWAAAVIIDRLLDTNIKKANVNDADKTYADASGITKESYQYGLINNPVYSAPVVVSNFNPQVSTNIEGIDVGGGVKVVRNGQLTDMSKIEDNDVIYEVKDLSGTKRYILDIDNKVAGEITDLTSTGIQIAGKDYAFGSSTVFNRLTNATTGFKVGDSVNVLLGYDGKVVDYFDIQSQDNSNFAFVVNYTDNVKDYTVKLLMIDGTTRTFKVASNPWYQKGKLVGYRMLDSETVQLTDLPYSNPGDLVIDKENRKIGDSYVSHNVKIFSIIANGTSLSQDANVDLVSWSDLPSGKVSSSDIQYMNKAGAFGDINVVVINDVFGENYKTAVVKSVNYRSTGGFDSSGNPGQTFSGYTLVIDGKEVSYSSSIPGATGGSVLKVKTTSSGGIQTISEIKNPASSPAKVDAIDLTRVMVNGTLYGIKGNVQVYFRDWAGGFTLKTIDDIEAGKEYNSVSIYLDKPLLYGGKVDTIIVQ